MTDPITSQVASNPDLSDKELARVLKVGTRRVAAVRASLGIPPHRVQKSNDANLWIRCPQATRTAVEALASTEGVTMSAWCAAAIVERMERVQERMARLVEPPTIKVGDRVRWVGNPPPRPWPPHWGTHGDVGVIRALHIGAADVHWDSDKEPTGTWRIDLANLAPESDYIGSP